MSEATGELALARTAPEGEAQLLQDLDGQLDRAASLEQLDRGVQVYLRPREPDGRLLVVPRAHEPGDPPEEHALGFAELLALG